MSIKIHKKPKASGLYILDWFSISDSFFIDVVDGSGNFPSKMDNYQNNINIENYEYIDVSISKQIITREKNI